jgi:hypothetical protein
MLQEATSLSQNTKISVTMTFPQNGMRFQVMGQRALFSCRSYTNPVHSVGIADRALLPAVRAHVESADCLQFFFMSS